MAVLRLPSVCAATLVRYKMGYPVKLSGVATFYTMYKRRPVGDYHVGVCTNTLCAVMGGDVIFERLNSTSTSATTRPRAHGRITLEHIEYNAACDYAPVMTVDWDSWTT